MFKRVICIIFIIIMMLQISIPIFAEDGSSIDDTHVVVDLLQMNIDGKPFDADEYKRNENADYISILSFMEYGYKYDGDKTNYGIYLYIYNPSCKTIQNNNLNKIQLATTNVNGYITTYNKYTLKLISESSDKMFYKYKVNNANTLSLQNNIRIYHVSGIELNYQGQANAKEFNIANTYTYTGFQKGYGADKTLHNLNCIADELLTIQLDLKSLYFRTDSSYLGVGHQNELQSVYFAIDNWIFDKYGELYSVKTEWNEARIQLLTFTDSQEELQYKTLKAQGAFNSGDYPTYHVNKEYKTIFMPPDQTITTLQYDYVLNMQDEYFTVINNNVIDNSNLPYSLYDSDLNVAPEEILKKYKYDDLVQEVEGPPSPDGIYPTIKIWGVDEGRQAGYNQTVITFNDTFKLKSYMSERSKWDMYLDYGFFNFDIDYDELYEKLSDDKYGGKIITVKPSDFTANNKTDENTLLVDSSLIPKFRNDVIYNEINNKKTVLLRFASVDYYSADITREYSKTDKRTDGAIISQQTLFDDFDIIELTFRDSYNNDTVIPVVASPIDIIGPVTPPFEPPLKAIKISDIIKLLGIILGIILLLIALPFIIKFFEWLSKKIKLLIKAIKKYFEPVTSKFKKKGKKKKK